MGTIERRECPEHGPDTGVVFTERGVTRCGHGEGRACGKELVTVEYVPASQLRGAVEAALSDLMGEALKQHPEPTPDELATAIGYLVLRRVGGQCATSPAPPSSRHSSEENR